MAKDSDPEQIPDDIDLLNIHRYPESVPASMVVFVRNSKVCQKRLGELLRGLPEGVHSKNDFNDLVSHDLPGKGQSKATLADHKHQKKENKGFQKIVRKLFP